MYQILTWSATCCMWRVEKVSKWEDKKNFIALSCAKKKHTTNHDFAVCHKKTHGKVFLCRVLKKTHGKPWLCRVLWFCRVFSWAHSAKIMFAVCPWICTRQTMVHTAKSKFPVVNAHTIDYKKNLTFYEQQSLSFCRQVAQPQPLLLDSARARTGLVLSFSNSSLIYIPNILVLVCDQYC